MIALLLSADTASLKAAGLMFCGVSMLVWVFISFFAKK